MTGGTPSRPKALRGRNPLADDSVVYNGLRGIRASRIKRLVRTERDAVRQTRVKRVPLGEPVSGRTDVGCRTALRVASKIPGGTLG
jgi:hypothetical protein